jgi:hypothetical protein
MYLKSTGTGLRAAANCYMLLLNVIPFLKNHVDLCYQAVCSIAVNLEQW